MQDPPLSDFPRDEYDARIERLRSELDRARLDGIIVLNEFNHRYLSGHWGERFPFFPTASIYSADGRAVVICSAGEKGQAEASSWVGDIRAYDWDEHEAHSRAAVEMLADAAREMGIDGGRIGRETSGRIGASLDDIAYLERRMPHAVWGNANTVLKRLRAIKSPREVDTMRRAIEITEDARAQTFAEVHVGMTERELFRTMVSNLFRAGSDGLGYVLVKHLDGSYGYSDRPYEADDVIYIDAGAIHKGYWCDRQRFAAFGDPSEDVRTGYSLLHELTRAMLEEVRAGTSAREFTERYLRHVERIFGHLDGAAPMMPRWAGHGIGLEEAEGPSLSLDSDAVLEPGNLIMVEPLVLWGDGWYTTEDCVVVTEDGYEEVGPPTPADLPVVPLDAATGDGGSPRPRTGAAA
jgi:Xaa-Pro aminopeptidase